jgi:HEAT repeat protein
VHEPDLDLLLSGLDAGTGKRFDAILRLAALGEPAVAGLLDRLHSGDARTRYAIARAFTDGRWPAEFYERAEVAEALLAALGDDHAPVRRRAARALGYFCEPRLAAATVGWLGSPNAADRYRGQRALRDAAAAAACRALDDPAVESRRSAVATLAELRTAHPHTIVKLRRLLGHDPDDEVRGGAARCIGVTAFLASEAIEALSTTLRDTGAGPETRLGAIAGLTPHAARLGSVGMLSTAPDLIDTLAVALRDRWVPLRAAAIQTLVAMGGPRVPAVLAPLLADENHHVRAEALVAHVAMRASDALELACRALRDDGSYHVREAAAAALARLGDERAVPVLRAALSDPDQFVRAEATRALSVFEAEPGEVDAVPVGICQPAPRPPTGPRES